MLIRLAPLEVATRQPLPVQCVHLTAELPSRPRLAKTALPRGHWASKPGLSEVAGAVGQVVRSDRELPCPGRGRERLRPLAQRSKPDKHDTR